MKHKTPTWSVGGLIGTVTESKSGLMPAGLYVKKYTIIPSKQSYEITNVNGFLGIYNSYTSKDIVPYWASFGLIKRLTDKDANYINLSFKEDNTTLVLTNYSEQTRPITIFYQNLKI